MYVFFFGTTSLQKSRGLFIKILADKRYLIIENHVFSQNNLHYLRRIVAFSAQQSKKKHLQLVSSIQEFSENKYTLML